MKNKTIIAPSILSGDFANLGLEAERLQRAGADFIHCDVMDGVFVPNITFGQKAVADLKKRTSLPLDVHLMIVKPERYAEQFLDAGADYLTFHLEATDKSDEILKTIRDRKKKGGLVISPDTDVKKLKNHLTMCDIVLLMSVYPGFGGQKFIERSIERLAELTALAKKENPEIIIEIDGGVTLENVARIKAAGAEAIVAGNTIFGAPDMRAAIEALRKA